MQFWLKCSIAVCLAGMATGCASPEDKVINEDHEYVNAAERGPLLLPDGVSRPVGSDEFLLPDHNSRGEVGEALDIQSPPQLLALASGSRLDEKNKVNKIWFDRTTVIDDLPEFTFDALKSYLDINNIEGSELNFKTKRAKTGWIEHTREGGFWLWGESQRSTGYRFETIQSQTKSGVTTAVDVKLIGHRVNGKEIPVSSLTQAQINRAEISFLNDYIFHYQLIQEDLMREAKVTRAEDFTLHLDEYEQGRMAFQSEKDIETVWVSVRTLLESAGFKVDDLDRTSKKLYVTYKKPEQGFWSSLWSDDEGIELPLKAGAYVIKVENDAERKSRILFLDQNEQALDKAQYKGMESVLIKLGQKLDLKL